jgi:HNH endonuclease
MGSHLFSLGRRPIESRTLDDFEGTLKYHGALGYRDHSVGGPPSELARLHIVPLVFGLLPTESLVRRGHDQLVKPAIRTHLKRVGAPMSESLVDVLKAVADQFWSTWPINIRYGNIRCRRKGSIADLRANPLLYKQILVTQGGRCAVCGTLFEAPGDETLDHTVPFRIVGDAPDGANWQILCPACNGGKAERLSALQSLEAMNWSYRDAVGSYVRTPSLQARYVVLAQAGGCEHTKCKVRPSVAELMIQRISITGLWVADNLQVRCPVHASDEAQRPPIAIAEEA